MDKTKDKTIIVVILIVILTLMVSVSLSYAFFSARVKGVESESTIVMEGGTISITYTDGNGILNVTGVYPREKEWITKKFTVTGNNDMDMAAYYKIKMAIDNNEFEADALHYTLESENTGNNGNAVPSVTQEYIGTENIEIGQGYFANTDGEDKVHSYTLKIYFLDTNEDQNENQGKSFAAHIVIESGDKATLSAPKRWSEAESGTLLAGIKMYSLKMMQPITNPEKESSRIDEASLAGAPDDYGMSYYYRGAVTNNYVQFANKCWRMQDMMELLMTQSSMNNTMIMPM